MTPSNDVYPVHVADGFVLPAILPHDLTLYVVLRLTHAIVALRSFTLIPSSR